MHMNFGGKALAAADGVTFVLRRAARAVRPGLRTMLRHPIGLCANFAAAGSAACARKPHRPPWGWGLVAMEAITGSDAYGEICIGVSMCRTQLCGDGPLLMICR